LLLNFHYGKRNKVITFADDVLIAVRAENFGEAANFAKIEINKITNWAKENKINFKEQKFKVMLAARMKRREITEVNIYLNSKPLQQAKK